MAERGSVGEMRMCAAVAVAGVVIWLLLVTISGCQGSDSEPCGNVVPIAFHRVVDGPDCEECSQHHFKSPITHRRNLSILSRPEFVLGRCEVVEVEAWHDAVGITLGQGAYTALAETRQRVMGSEGPDSLIAVFLEGEREPFSVIHAAELGLYMMLLGFDSRDLVHEFVRELGSEESLVIEMHDRALEGGDAADAESQDSDQLIRELEAEAAALEELEGRVESGALDGEISERAREMRAP